MGVASRLIGYFDYKNLLIHRLFTSLVMCVRVYDIITSSRTRNNKEYKNPHKGTINLSDTEDRREHPTNC